MSCVDEIIGKIVSQGGFSESNLRIVLNDYDIVEKSTEIAVADTDNRQQAIKMFIITKKVEGCSDTTIQYYLYVLRRFFEEINDNPEDIKSDRIRYYLAVRSTRDGLSRTTQDNELRILKSFFGWCSTEGYISKNPTSNIKPIKQEKRIKKAFSETDLEMIRRNAISKREKAIIETLYSTGCRVSELCGMNRSDIDGDEIMVFGKGGKERVVYLNAKARIAIDEYIEIRNDTDIALFVGEKKPNTRLTPGSVERIVRRIGKRANIANCHPHRFRRTAATIALNRGMPLEQVQQMLGHDKIETTTIYARSEMENVKTSHRKYVI